MSMLYTGRATCAPCVSPIAVQNTTGAVIEHGVSYDDVVLSIHTEALAAAVVAALPISGGIFAKWRAIADGEHDDRKIG